jgi:hypothetical protein
MINYSNRLREQSRDADTQTIEFSIATSALVAVGDRVREQMRGVVMETNRLTLSAGIAVGRATSWFGALLWRFIGYSMRERVFAVALVTSFCLLRPVRKAACFGGSLNQRNF